MKQTLHYNEEIADKLLENFVKLTGFNIKSRKRKPEDAYIRCLLYKILYDINKMNDRMISDFLESKGRKTNRVSIFQSLKKVGVYYTTYKKFRQYYDVYFVDQKELGIKTEERQKAMFEKEIKKIEVRKYEQQFDALETLINDLPFERRPEILELLTLRVKSWDWKAKNEYEVIECSGALSGTW